MTNKLYLIRGLPGSGKTTYAKSLNCFYVEADMFHYKNGKYQFHRANLPSAHKWTLAIVASALINGAFDIAVSNTFVRKEQMQPYIDLAKISGYQVVIITMKNNYKSTHNVPDDVIQKYRAEWEQVQGEQEVS